MTLDLCLTAQPRACLEREVLRAAKGRNEGREREGKRGISTCPFPEGNLCVVHLNSCLLGLHLVNPVTWAVWNHCNLSSSPPTLTCSHVSQRMATPRIKTLDVSQDPSSIPPKHFSIHTLPPSLGHQLSPLLSLAYLTLLMGTLLATDLVFRKPVRLQEQAPRPAYFWPARLFAWVSQSLDKGLWAGPSNKWNSRDTSQIWIPPRAKQELCSLARGNTCAPF